jgi:hypothetical protein
MDDLNNICTNKLDNADLSILFSNTGDAITLNFTVAGTREIVLFKCSNILNFKITKDYEETDNSYFVGKTSVSIISTKDAILQTRWTYGDRNMPDNFYKINIEGAIELEITCQIFTWEINKSNS